MLKKSVVIGAHKLRKSRPAFNDYKSVIYLCVLACGVCFGVMLSRNGGEWWHSFWGTIINNHLTAKLDSSLLMNFCGAFTPVLILLLYCFVFGMCGVGAPFLYLAPLALGVFSGTCGAELYHMFSIEGLAYWCCVNIPCNAIVAATLIRCCCYGSELSSYIFSVMIYPKTERREHVLKDYSIKFLVMLVPVALGALLSTATFALVGKLFSFLG